MTESIGDYSTSTCILGKVILTNISQIKCQTENCDRVSFTYNMANLINERLDQLEEIEINKLPIGDFIDRDELCKILKCTARELSRMPRVRRGFIMYKKFGKNRLYYKPSVDKYIASGNKDGRILLVK